MISRAKTRIFISSLYLGSEESELVSTILPHLSSYITAKLDISPLFSPPINPISSPPLPTRPQPFNPSGAVEHRVNPSPPAPRIPLPRPCLAIQKPSSARINGCACSPTIQRRVGNMACKNIRCRRRGDNQRVSRFLVCNICMHKLPCNEMLMRILLLVQSKSQQIVFHQPSRPVYPLHISASPGRILFRLLTSRILVLIQLDAEP